MFPGLQLLFAGPQHTVPPDPLLMSYSHSRVNQDVLPAGTTVYIVPGSTRGLGHLLRSGSTGYQYGAIWYNGRFGIIELKKFPLTQVEWDIQPMEQKMHL